jgi:hypothetical protein
MSIAYNYDSSVVVEKEAVVCRYVELASTFIINSEPKVQKSRRMELVKFLK